MHTVRIYGGASNMTINLDPESQGNSMAATHGHNPVRMSMQSNPFADAHSIQSASTGTHSNVIPIALVPHGSVSLRSNTPSSGAPSSGPVRPERAVDLGLNYDHASAPGDSIGASKQYAKSQVSNIRNSYMTTGSFASDLLNEAPVIVTSSQGVVKQVVGVVKAEVIHTPPGSVYSSPEGNNSTGSLSVASSRPPVRSPLGGSSFGPLEPMAEEQGEEEQNITTRGDPFGDEHSPYPSASPTAASGISPAPTTTTFTESEAQGPRAPWKKLKEPRPVSVNTQAGSIIGATISNASRVHLGFNQISPGSAASRSLVVPASSDLPHTPISAPLSTARSQYRMTSAKLVSPMTSSDTSTPSLPSGVLERQQRQAIEEMEATRMSRASVVSSTSTRADSILEGFPFVPPSPISDRPIRTPPRSPLAQQAFSGRSVSPSKPAPETPLPPPPNRKLLGMSTASQSSTVSNGLGSFPFQIDNGSGPDTAEQATTPSSYPGKQRASLDTLALTADLQSYPLGFDRDAAMAHYPPNNRR